MKRRHSKKATTATMESVSLVVVPPGASASVCCPTAAGGGGCVCQVTALAPTSPCSPARSLGTGSLAADGDKVESFTLSPTSRQRRQQQQERWPVKMTPTPDKSTWKSSTQAVQGGSMMTVSTTNSQATTATEPRNSFSSMAKRSLLTKAPPVFKRALSSFLRVADLDMQVTCTGGTAVGVETTASSDLDSEESFPNFHRVAVDPPPGHEHDPNELWVCLDNGNGEHAPIAPLAVAALAKSGLFTTFDQRMWVAEGKTSKVIQKQKQSSASSWYQCTWEQKGPIQLPTQIQDKEEVLVWSGKFTHGRYGSDLPAVRSAALIDMAPEALMDLLVDSNRVKEYNAMSLGRQDLLVLQDTLEGGVFGGITKVMRSETRPPLVRKTLSFTSILHVKKLEDDSGYKLVSRAVTSPDTASLAGTLQSEILLSVNIIKKIQGNPQQCLMVAVNHIRSPMVPMMIAKRIGLAAAVNFINDVRACS